MWELDHKEGWEPKNWCFWTVVLEKTLENLLGCKEIQPVHPIGNQSWIVVGRIDAEVEAALPWPPDVKNWLIGKNPDARKDWRQEEKGTTEDEMVGWHHGLNGHEFEQALGVGDGQGSLARCSLWGHKESDMTEQLSNNNLQSWVWAFSFESHSVQHRRSPQRKGHKMKHWMCGKKSLKDLSCQCVFSPHILSVTSFWALMTSSLTQRSCHPCSLRHVPTPWGNTKGDKHTGPALQKLIPPPG